MGIRSLIGAVLPIVIFGFSFGLYEVLFPLYMNFLNISLLSMGFAFTVSALVVTIANVFIGERSDVLGRKIFFSSALLLGGISHLTTSFSSSLVPLTVLKILFDMSVAIKNAVFVPMLFDQDKENFISVYSKMSGLEFIFQAVGLALSGFLVEFLGYHATFILSGILQIFGFVVFSTLFVERTRNRLTNKSNDRKSYSKFPKQLVVLSVSGLILFIGSSASHSFITPLFFSEKFALSPVMVSALMTIHRLSLGVPLMYSDRIIKKLKKFQLKFYLILFVSIQGFFTVISTFPDLFVVSAFLWVLHDFIGASLWLPIRNYMIQQYCREDSRGKDYNLVSSISSIGSIVGPFLAGISGTISINLPFRLSGLMIILSNVPLYIL